MSLKITKDGKPAFDKPSKELRQAARKVLAIAEVKRWMPESAWKLPDPLMHAQLMPLMKEEHDRIAALFDHYNIKCEGNLLAFPSSRDLQRLVVALATDFIPNFDVFAVSSGRGRKPGRKHDFGDALISAVEKLRGQRNISVTAACTILARRSPWNEGEGAAKGSLETRYYEAKKERKEKLRLMNEHWRAMVVAAQEEKRRMEEQAANPQRPTRGLLAQALMKSPDTPAQATENPGE